MTPPTVHPATLPFSKCLISILRRFINAEKIKYIFMSHYHSRGKNHNIKIGNKSFENVSVTVTNQNHIHQEVKSRLHFVSACYHSLWKLLSSRIISKIIKIKMCKPIISPLILHGCETWSLIQMEEQRLRVLENRVLRRIFGPKRVEVTGDWRKLHNEELHNLCSTLNIIRV
jgi:hypothetical protein